MLRSVISIKRAQCKRKGFRNAERIGDVQDKGVGPGPSKLHDGPAGEVFGGSELCNRDVRIGENLPIRNETHRRLDL